MNHVSIFMAFTALIPANGLQEIAVRLFLWPNLSSFNIVPVGLPVRSGGHFLKCPYYVSIHWGNFVELYFTFPRFFVCLCFCFDWGLFVYFCLGVFVGFFGIFLKIITKPPPTHMKEIYEYEYSSDDKLL